MADIVNILRNLTKGDAYEAPWTFRCHCHEAADEIERLRAAQMPGVDDLAQIIRIVDGNHSLGAGALAEAIIAKFREGRDDGAMG